MPFSTKNLLLILFVWATGAFALPVDKIYLGGETLVVEVALTEKDTAKGLMGRKELKEGNGMLFVYAKPDILTFWMKNTYIPLSVAFFDEKKTLINFCDMYPSEDDSPPLYKSSAPAVYALEVPQGWFEKHKIVPGMKFSFRHPGKPLQ
ncbi:MAG: DUF192 domain-containing protein [Verrucomicrobia bacterium]|nr:DUF192 domain-containing protein [Verrucomicrobiota bacterium]